jgi:hypothetical protein
MNYTVEMNGNVIELPKYTISVMEKIEQVENKTNSSASTKTKLQGLYEFSCNLVGKEKVEEVIGKFEEADPNDINILYLSIVREYNKPLNDFEMDKGMEQIKELNNSEITKLGDTVSKFENLVNQAQVQAGKKYHK